MKDNVTYGRKCQIPKFTGDTKNCLTFTQLILNETLRKRFEVWLGFIELWNKHPETCIHLRENLCQKNGASPKTLILIHKELRNFFIFELKKKQDCTFDLLLTSVESPKERLKK